MLNSQCRYPYVVTERGCALVFDYRLPQLKPQCDNNGVSQTAEESRSVELDLKHSRLVLQQLRLIFFVQN